MQVPEVPIAQSALQRTRSLTPHHHPATTHRHNGHTIWAECSSQVTLADVCNLRNDAHRCASIVHAFVVKRGVVTTWKDQCADAKRRERGALVNHFEQWQKANGISRFIAAGSKFLPLPCCRRRSNLVGLPHGYRVEDHFSWMGLCAATDRQERGPPGEQT